jgi:hypothetical protein
MGVQVVGRETNDLDIASIKLVLESGNETKLGGADRGYVRERVLVFCLLQLRSKESIHTEISRVREEDHPVIADEFMELDGTLSSLGFEVFNPDNCQSNNHRVHFCSISCILTRSSGTESESRHI